MLRKRNQEIIQKNLEWLPETTFDLRKKATKDLKHALRNPLSFISQVNQKRLRNYRRTAYVVKKFGNMLGLNVQFSFKKKGRFNDDIDLTKTKIIKTRKFTREEAENALTWIGEKLSRVLAKKEYYNHMFSLLRELKDGPSSQKQQNALALIEELKKRNFDVHERMLFLLEHWLFAEITQIHK